eukprot:TRINITY_DN2842_c0_g1_i1.p1 TRINITY_DN2842_c0_g1~~TRINITY_DN2842_c0_g1_i1.p1  ORF type:complete len:521 (+),score=205.55 TRINITY_DN2842_c0_g1_i1:63-1625(+)
MSGSGAMKIVLKGETEFPAVKAGDAKKMLAMACLKAPEMKEEGGDQRAAVRICAVIDRSGSMRGEKIQMVAQTLEFVVRELSANDQFGIIAYDNNITKPLEMLYMTKENQHKALNAIRNIRPGGATNLSGGLLEGMKEIKALKKASTDATTPATHCVWLFTDGHANEGLTTTEDITSAMDTILGDESDMVIHTFGFGASHNDTMLRSLAESGSGQYYYIENAEVIKETFAECLGGLLTVVATNIVVKMAPAKGVDVVSCLNDLTMDLKDLTFKMKDIYSEETRDFVVEFNLPATEPTECYEVAAATLQYLDFEGKPQEASIVITVPRPEEVDEDKMEVNEGLDMQRNRLETANALKQAQVEANNGEFEKARVTLDVTQQKLKMSKCFGRLEACSALYEDLEEASSNMSRQKWDTVGSKCVNAWEYSHRNQRSCGAKTKYKTSKQACMISNSSAYTPVAPVPVAPVPLAKPEPAAPTQAAGSEVPAMANRAKSDGFLSRSLKSAKKAIIKPQKKVSISPEY